MDWLDATSFDGTVTRLPAGTADPGWTWPPSAVVSSVQDISYDTEDWAPASSVRHPWVRVGRWTLLYRRAS
ncbi:hypothetical protein SAMN05660657_04985 [Geodermatophilus amargosae]|uniref:Uncharacterized protein n=1 Tax=Geodermatophilus amargosae TaxID=1296565 RepID=A0A1I7CX79_9ACTN|nr:hypothetical protein [Geodermatophilus amargosae]SFU03998.1 hypothetical protein SAMN05660657_04985 [Geodermatophilus amargosae]